MQQRCYRANHATLEAIRELRQKHPIPPEDVAQVFLIQNSFMRGTILDCVGGARIK